MAWDVISQTTDSVTRSDAIPRPKFQETQPHGDTGKTEGKTMAAEAEKKRDAEVSQRFLEELEKDIGLIHNIGLKFSVHSQTGRTMVKVINKDSGNTIREIPPKKLLDLAAKLDEMIGIIFDKKV